MDRRRWHWRGASAARRRPAGPRGGRRGWRTGPGGGAVRGCGQGLTSGSGGAWRRFLTKGNQGGWARLVRPPDNPGVQEPYQVYRVLDKDFCFNALGKISGAAKLFELGEFVLKCNTRRRSGAFLVDLTLFMTMCYGEFSRSVAKRNKNCILQHFFSSTLYKMRRVFRGIVSRIARWQVPPQPSCSEVNDAPFNAPYHRPGALSKSVQRTHPSTKPVLSLSKGSGQALAQGPTPAYRNPVSLRTTHRDSRSATHGTPRHPIVQSLPSSVQPCPMVRSQRQLLLLLQTFGTLGGSLTFVPESSSGQAMTKRWRDAGADASANVVTTATRWLRAASVASAPADCAGLC